ncbi:HdeD family acid-resistance protein [Actinomycetospora cinnamomea]|uniref:Uncharacterized membrane protein HdeD (DUF308 family) n=1 Tax=Actinomycetospora cinnamomea TaxID=663609 RepID=A0A2U1FRL7_9PSEU|nr:DUF308 domain-containing protein [Actinomycetospora cinnamomea]PVZ14813.1 uncharacterized membrane protein HdeD (DUF308 family) [Actinomycetospora cinnamomea]
MTSAVGGPGVRRASSGWGWVLASGILGVLVGVIALFFPGLAILSAAIVLGIVLIVQGALEIGVAWRAGTGSTGRGWLAAFGVLVLVAGILVLFRPGGGILVLVWGLILWFVLAGVHDLIIAGSQREHRVWNIVVGVLSLIVAFVLLVSPGTAVGVLALFIALGFLFRGAMDIGLALSMRRTA